jgi:putative membrane protein
MKRLYLCGLGLGLLLGVACNSSPDSVKDAQKANDSTVDSLSKKQSVTDSSTAVPSKQDADFMVKAASGGMLEVELGKLAQSNANRQGVKDFGAMMVQDHGKGGETLKALAMRKRIVLPDAVSNDQQKERDDLMKKRGSEFDRSYITLMVKDHKEDIDEFEKAAKDANDPEIRDFAQNTLPMLHHHLDSAQSLDKKIGRKLSGPKTAPPYQ